MIREWIALDAEIKRKKASLNVLTSRHKMLTITIKYLKAQLTAYFAETQFQDEGARIVDHIISHRNETTRDLLDIKQLPQN